MKTTISSSTLKEKVDSMLEILVKEYPDRIAFKRANLSEAASSVGISENDFVSLFIQKDRRVSFGVYSLEAEILAFRNRTHSTDESNSIAPINSISKSPKAPAPVHFYKEEIQAPMFEEHRTFVPEKDRSYVPWGEYTTIKRIIESREFFPVYLSGSSGNGKTIMVEQICATLGREYIRVQFTQETDEVDIIGSHRLVDGNTIFQVGPVIAAMQAGAIVLLDECLEENEKVRIGTVNDWKPVSLKELEENKEYPIVSYNLKTSELENDTGSVISKKEEEIFEVELENGKKILVTGNHPFIIAGNLEKSIEDGLREGDEIIFISDEF